MRLRITEKGVWYSIAIIAILYFGGHFVLAVINNNGGIFR